MCLLCIPQAPPPHPIPPLGDAAIRGSVNFPVIVIDGWQRTGTYRSPVCHSVSQRQSLGKKEKCRQKQQPSINQPPGLQSREGTEVVLHSVTRTAETLIDGGGHQGRSVAAFNHVQQQRGALWPPKSHWLFWERRWDAARSQCQFGYLKAQAHHPHFLTSVAL